VYYSYAVPRQKRFEALKIPRSVTELFRDDPACLSCHIYGDLQDKKGLVLEEVWKAEEDLDLHIRSDEYPNLLLLLVLEMALKQPEIRFDTISSSTGIETIKKARSHARRAYWRSRPLEWQLP
jgi:quinol monooxygenase YgiN